MAERSEAPGEVAVAGTTAAAIGLFWGWSQALAPAAMGLVAGGAAAGAIALALLSRPILRSLSGARSKLGIAAATFGVFFLLPAATSHTSFVADRSATALAPIAAVAVVAIWLVGLALARGGPIGAGIALAAATTWAVATAPVESGVLPSPRATEIPAEAPSASRVAVIGIDSGDWRVLDPLLAAGELPHLRGLVERGVAGVLRSAEPTFSPVVWSSIFTGKTPEKHGITGWYESHNANLRARPLWNLIESAGLESVVVNVPGTWPPRQMQGALISGFPIPALLTPPPDRPQEVVGIVIATADRPNALVPTAVLPQRDGVAEGVVEIGEAALPRRTRLRNVAIEVLSRHRLLPPRALRVPVRIAPASGARQRIDFADHAIELAPGEWSPWLPQDVFGQPMRFRLRALEGGGVYCTPFYPDPRRPFVPIASDPARAARAFGDSMYVVESAGWRMAGDRDLRRPLAEHLRDVEDQHERATRILAAEIPDWKLLVHVITITDRSSHAFWRFQDPSVAAGTDPAEIAESRAALADAYRDADARLGRLLDWLGPETTILVTSDHGSAPSAEDPLWGGHRVDGIWIAAGPGVRPRPDRVEMSIYDVTPTVLTLLGLPAAGDMDGIARSEILAAPGEREQVASYEVEDGAAVTRVRVDTSTVDQLRSLGYVE